MNCQITKRWLRYLSFSLKSNSKRKRYSMLHRFFNLSKSNFWNMNFLNLQFTLLRKKKCTIQKKARCYQKRFLPLQLSHLSCLTRRNLQKALDARERVAHNGETKYCAKSPLALFSSRLWKSSRIFLLRTTWVKQRAWLIQISVVSK